LKNALDISEVEYESDTNKKFDIFDEKKSYEKDTEIFYQDTETKDRQMNASQIEILSSQIGAKHKTHSRATRSRTTFKNSMKSSIQSLSLQEIQEKKKSSIKSKQVSLEKKSLSIRSPKSKTSKLSKSPHKSSKLSKSPTKSFHKRPSMKSSISNNKK
jgi:hypothetical protein